MKKNARKFKRFVIDGAKSITWGWKHKHQSLPVYTSVASSGLKVHLGSGPINIQGWVNVDARPYSHVHLVSEGLELQEFADNMISEIYLCHVLEHFSFNEAKTLLVSLFKKLAPGGVLRLSVPSFDLLIDVYRESGNNLELIKYAVMGGQDYQYNFHRSLYNREALCKLLGETGFTNATEWKTLEDFGVDLGDWSSGSIRFNGTSKYISLNIKAVKKA